MSLVEQVLARVFVDDIEAALPFYRALAGGAEVRRFTFRDVELAWVGSFLLLRVDPARRADYARVATLVVSDIDEARRLVEAAGGTVLEGPGEAPNGPRMVARGPDGSVFEYIVRDRAGRV